MGFEGKIRSRNGWWLGVPLFQETTKWTSMPGCWSTHIFFGWLHHWITLFDGQILDVWSKYGFLSVSHSIFHGCIPIFAAEILFFSQSSFFACDITIFGWFPMANAIPFPGWQGNCCQPWAMLESWRGRWQSPMDIRKGWGRAQWLHIVSSNSAGPEQANWWFLDLRWWTPDLMKRWYISNFEGLTRVDHGILHGNTACKWGKWRYFGNLLRWIL